MVDEQTRLPHKLALGLNDWSKGEETWEAESARIVVAETVIRLLLKLRQQQR